jgi:aquaporin Z
MEPVLAGLYIVTQLVAGVVAALLLRWLLPTGRDGVEAGTPALGAGVSGFEGMVIEAILTFFLVWVIFASAADPRGTFKSIAGLAIGFTITLDILAGGPLTGAAMNPARAFGPELVSGTWSDAWVWYIGPILGGGVAAIAYEWLYLRPLGPEPVGPPETGVVEPRPGETALS